MHQLDALDSARMRTSPAANIAAPRSGSDRGSTGTETRQMGPRTHTYRWRVSECDPPHRLGFETTSGPMRPAGNMAFRSDGDATRVELTLALNPRGLMRILAPLIQRQVQKTTNEHLILFKQRLETDRT